MRLSPDYTFLISKGLLNHKLIKKIAHDVFILTVSGRSLLERSAGISEKKNISTLIEVSRGFGGRIELSSFEPEMSFFINKGFAVEEAVLSEHNLGKGLITEITDARSIQKSIKRLTKKGDSPHKEASYKPHK
ncbi:MAG: hypothetical protein HYW78_02705 [Parcubacteria group bacterium]|nr:hypothetical protein [Parcubacteria group bacterium]